MTELSQWTHKASLTDPPTSPMASFFNPLVVGKFRWASQRHIAMGLCRCDAHHNMRRVAMDFLLCSGGRRCFLKERRHAPPIEFSVTVGLLSGIVENRHHQLSYMSRDWNLWRASDVLLFAGTHFSFVHVPTYASHRDAGSRLLRGTQTLP